MPQTPRLEVGDKAPAFSLPDADGNTVKLSDYKGRRVIVYFYPAAATPGCTKQACDFRDGLSALLSDPDRKVLTAWGAYGEKTMYGKTVQGVIRSTFVVDEKGKIAEAQYNVRAAHTTTKIQKILAQFG